MDSQHRRNLDHDRNGMDDDCNGMDGMDDDLRKRQLLVGLGVLGGLLAVVPAFYVVWRFVPGVPGEWLGVIAGVISTPFLLEIFFVITGIFIVVGINHWRQKREGDDFVYLEQVSDPDTPGGLPERSKFAIYRERPPEGVEPDMLDRIEGAIEIGDDAEAGELLAGMSEVDLHDPAVLALRLKLAQVSGKTELARRIEQEIAGRS